MLLLDLFGSIFGDGGKDIRFFIMGMTIRGIPIFLIIATTRSTAAPPSSWPMPRTQGLGLANITMVTVITIVIRISLKVPALAPRASRPGNRLRS